MERFYAGKHVDGSAPSGTSRCCKPTAIIFTTALLATSAILGTLHAAFSEDASVPASVTACELFPNATDHLRAVSIVLALWLCLFCTGVLTLGLCFRRGDFGSSRDPYPRASKLNTEFDGSIWLVGDEVEFFNTGSTSSAQLKSASVVAFVFFGVTAATVASVWLSKW